jgi:hypothetical protein
LFAVTSSEIISIYVTIEEKLRYRFRKKVYAPSNFFRSSKSLVRALYIDRT